MAKNLISFEEEVEPVSEALNNPPEFSDFPQTMVTEKIIFCLDGLLLSSDDEELIHNLFFLCKSYINLKKKICVKPPEFECLLVMDSETITYSCINNDKDLKATFSTIKNYYCEEEKEPLEIDKIFNKIAEIVELPDPDCQQKYLPPPWVYHVVWLFGRNLFIPKMENTNSFDFLMMTPYFALDILYMYDKTSEDNLCEQISHCLPGLNENGKGYFVTVNVNQKPKFFSCFAQLLGHPLIRSPQLKAKFNILELGPQLQIVKKDNIEE